MVRKADESNYVKRARLRLAKIMAKGDKQVTESALQKIKEGMRYWIHRHSEERVPLKDKSIELFDANEHPAQAKSTYVHKLLKKLTKELPAEGSLKGRISQ